MIKCLEKYELAPGHGFLIFVYLEKEITEKKNQIFTGQLLKALDKTIIYVSKKEESS